MAGYDSRVDTWRHIHRVRQLLDGAVAKLLKRGQEHDQTKLSSPEREVFDEATPRLRDLVFGSREYREALSDMEPALVHHYEHNSHHPEHYANGIKGMSLLDLVEMICDWKAAGERHADGGDIMRSIEHNASRFGIGPQLRTILENTAEEMGWVQSFFDVCLEKVQAAEAFTAEELQRLREQPGVTGIDSIPGRNLKGENVYHVSRVHMASGGDVAGELAA